MDIGGSKNMETKTNDNAENKSSYPTEKIYQGLAKVASKLNDMLFDEDVLDNDVNKKIEKGDDSKRGEEGKKSDVDDSGENTANETSDLLSKNISELLNKLFLDDKPSGDGTENNTDSRNLSEKNIEDEKFEKESSKFADSPLEKKAEKADSINRYNSENYDSPIVKEAREIIKNKSDGLAREKEVGEELEEKYPTEQGYQIVSEVYLRDKDGNIVKDPVSGEARRVDFMVVKDGEVVDSIEVTSKTADKTGQLAKEERIRDAGGNYIQDNDGNLVEIPDSLHTHVERRD